MVVASLEEFQRWEWLRWVLSKAPGWALSDAELLSRVQVSLKGSDRVLVLGEIERRLGMWPEQDQARVIQRLLELERENRAPGPPAQDVDRLLQRLLRKVNPAPARALATICARSDRLGRRRAAWRFFREHECNEDGSAEVARAFDSGERDPELLHLIASDSKVLKRVDRQELLASLPEFYWRGRVMMTLLEERDEATAKALSGEFPGEVIFAIRRLRRNDLVSTVQEVIEAHPDDPDVVSNAIIAFALFDRAPALHTATLRGEKLVAARMHRLVLDQSAARSSITRSPSTGS